MNFFYKENPARMTKGTIDNLENVDHQGFVRLRFILIMGAICNSLAFWVTTRKRQRSQSTFFYLAVLAIADQMVYDW